MRVLSLSLSLSLCLSETSLSLSLSLPPLALSLSLSLSSLMYLHRLDMGVVLVQRRLDRRLSLELNGRLLLHRELATKRKSERDEKTEVQGQRPVAEEEQRGTNREQAGERESGDLTFFASSSTASACCLFSWARFCWRASFSCTWRRVR